MKRVTAFALLMTTAETSLDIGPAPTVESVGISGDDVIATRWTNKGDLTPPDQEIVLQAQKGTLSENPEAIAVNEENDIGLPV